MSNAFPGLKYIREDLEKVESFLLRESRSEVGLVIQVCDHIFKSGGKRIRPALLLLCSRLCGYQGEEAIAYAGAIEFAHTATLLHDDVVDKALQRRGRPSANKVFGNQVSILVGDYLVFKGFNILLHHENKRIMDLVNRIAIRMAEGEVHQLSQAKNPELSEQDYFEIITNKTALLFMAACRIGAMLADAPAEQEEALGEFGRKVGLSFQLVDDVQDYMTQDRGWGKPRGQDFIEGKMTLPLIRALNALKDKDRDWIKRSMSKSARDEQDLKKVIQLIEQARGFEATMNTAQELARSACQDLESFPPGQIKDALCELALHALTRTT